MGSATSSQAGKNAKKTESSNAPAESPIVRIQNTNDANRTTVEGFVNLLSQSNENVKKINLCKADITTVVSSDNEGVGPDVEVVESLQKTGFKYRKNWEKYGRRESRLRTKERCLVGLENMRKTASPQLMMASKENYGRIKDAADLFGLEPSGENIHDYPKSEMNELDTVNCRPSPSDVPKCETPNKTVLDISRSTNPHGETDNIRHSTAKAKGSSVSPVWLKPSSSSPSQKQYGGTSFIERDQNARSRCKSMDYNRGTSDSKLPASALAPLKYGKLGIQGGTIKKELEMEGLLESGSDGKRDPDVVLRELRQMGLFRQTSDGSGKSEQEESQGRATVASRLPPLETDVLSRRLEEKQQRHAERLEKLAQDREEKVRKFKERHKSARARRQQLQQQQSQQESYGDAERLKLKMMDMELI